MKLTFYPQEDSYTCNLANLRSALNFYGVTVSESELVNSVSKDYGKNFKNIWNPTIAKLARIYKLPVKLVADWPLLKRENIKIALAEYKSNPDNMNVDKYENQNDTDKNTEPLSLAYIEMFKAIELGCTVEFGKLNKDSLKTNLEKNKLIQTSIKLDKLYPGSKKTYHSILLHSLDGNKVIYNDPFKGQNLKTSIEHLINSATSAGAYMVYG